MARVTVDGKDYEIERMNALDEFDVAARFSFVLINMLGVRPEGDAAPKSGEPEAARFARVFCAFSAALQPADRRAGLLTCLRAVKRVDSGRLAPIVAGDAVTYPDIRLRQELELTWHVLEENSIAGFFAGPSAKAGGGAAETAAQ